MTDLNEFVGTITKRCTQKRAKIRNSWGVYDAYKAIRKNGWYSIGKPVKEHEFYSIIRKINKLAAEEISKGNEFVFPARMGKLEVRKSKRGVSIVDGRLRITYPIDWRSTLELWFQDSEAKKNKTLLRNENDVYQVKYNKYNANYNNKEFYQFALNRQIKKDLKNNILKGEVNVLW